jgi:DNA-binding MarR family transcriptional regulator
MSSKTMVGVDTPQMEAFRDLMRAQDALSRRLDRDLQQEVGLSMAEYWVLLTLRYSPDGSLPVGELSCEAHLTKSGVTRLIDRMERAGTVERVADTGDRRSVRACITEKGRSELRKAWPIHRRGIDEYFGASLTDAQAKTLSELLRRVASSGE